jgi:cell division control protein 6
MALASEVGIVLNADILSETYVPPTIPAREPHIEELKGCMSPALKGQKPLSAWLHGTPGTGKTTVASHVLNELNARTGIPGLYVNCWKHNSFYAVLEYALTEMRKGFGDARDKHVRLSQFESLVKDRPFLLVLDEIDLVPSGERNDMIYNLATIQKTGLICISENRYPILALEGRIRSRLNPQMIEFQPYTEEQLLDILRERASRALHQDSWNGGLLKLIASKAAGDARIAIQTLRNAAVYADSEGAAAISAKHVDKGHSDTRGLKKTYELKRLTDHHRLLYRLIKERPGVSSPDLFRGYIQECESRNWKPVAGRTFSLYMQKMTELKLVRPERARVKGRVYSFKPEPGP